MKEETYTSSDIIFYGSPEGNITVEVIYSGETFWLSQKRMAELFGVEVPAISKHLANIFESGELVQEATVSILEIVQQEDKRNSPILGMGNTNTTEFIFTYFNYKSMMLNFNY